MFFYNKKLLRQAGYDDAFIEAMPERTLSGDLTMDEVIDIAKQVVDKTDAQYGIRIGRTRAGLHHGVPAYGNSLVDPGTGNLLLERDKLAAAFGWFERGVKEASFRPTTPRWNSMHSARVLHGECGVLDVRHLGPGHLRVSNLRAAVRRAGFFADWGWIASPAVKKVGRRAA